MRTICQTRSTFATFLPSDSSYLNLCECCNIGDAGIQCLSSLTGLTYLNLSHCRLLKDISALAGCSNLAHLDLSYCDSLKEISVLAECKSLVHLNLPYPLIGSYPHMESAYVKYAMRTN